MPRKPAVEGEVYLVDKPVEPTLIAAAPTKVKKTKGKKKAELDAEGKPVIPADKIAVQVKPRRKYTRKPKPIPENEVVMPEPEVEEVEPSETSKEEEPVPRKSRAKKAPTRPRARYMSETSETSEYGDSTDSDSSEDAKISKYVRKVHKRAQALREIDERLQRMSNPYAQRGMSIF